MQKIAVGIGKKCFPGKNPMQMPQFLLPAAVLTVIFTVPMTFIMTWVGLKMGGVPMNVYWFAFLGALPWMLLAAYIGYTGLIEENLVLDCILRLLGKKPEFIEMNKTAFAKGLAAGKAAKEA